MTTQIIILFQEDIFLKEQINQSVLVLGKDAEERKLRFMMNVDILKARFDAAQGRPPDAVEDHGKPTQFWYQFGGGLWVLVQERPVRQTLFRRTQNFVIIWMQREGPRRS